MYLDTCDWDSIATVADEFELRSNCIPTATASPLVKDCVLQFDRVLTPYIGINNDFFVAVDVTFPNGNVESQLFSLASLFLEIWVDNGGMGYYDHCDGNFMDKLTRSAKTYYDLVKFLQGKSVAVKRVRVHEVDPQLYDGATRKAVYTYDYAY